MGFIALASNPRPHQGREAEIAAYVQRVCCSKGLNEPDGAVEVMLVLAMVIHRYKAYTMNVIQLIEVLQSGGPVCELYDLVFEKPAHLRKDPEDSWPALIRAQKGHSTYVEQKYFGSKVRVPDELSEYLWQCGRYANKDKYIKAGFMIPMGSASQGPVWFSIGNPKC